MGMRKKDLRVVRKPSAELNCELLDSRFRENDDREVCGNDARWGRGNTAQDRICPVDSSGA